MFKKIILSSAALCFIFSYANASYIQECEVRGVRPTDKVSTLEINPSITVLNDDVETTINNLTLKYYYTFSNIYTLGVELPGARFQSAGESKNGLGDVLFSASMVKKIGAITAYGLQLEGTLPTASDDVLGNGKVQLMPALFLEFAFPNNVFFSIGYKHYVSVAGEGDRANINMGRIRGLLGYLSEHNWWAILDTQYYMDYENKSKADLVMEVEVGTMLYDAVSLYIKPGWKVAGNMDTRKWSLSFGVKLLSI